MILTFSREKLLNAVNLLKGITRTKSNLQVTKCVRFTLWNGLAALAANDLEMSAVTSLSFKLFGSEDLTPSFSSRFLLHAGTLADILAEIKGQDIDIEIPDSITFGGDAKAVLRKGRMEIGLPLADPDDFPDIELIDSDTIFNVSAGDFINAVTRTLYASSNDETRYALTGLYMELKQGAFVMVGTDGFRMALARRVVSEGGTSPSLVLPARVAKYLKESIDEHSVIEITLGEKKAQFVTPALTVVSRVIDQKYPDYEAILSGAPAGLCFVKRADLLGALKRFGVLTGRTEPVVVRRSRYGLRLDTEAQNGSYARETIECRWRDDVAPMPMALGQKFLLDAVEHLSDEETIIQYPQTYGTIRIDEGEGSDPDYTVMVMPIRGDSIKPLDEADEQAGDIPDDSMTQRLNDSTTMTQGSAEVAREAHNLNDGSSNPSPATKKPYRLNKISRSKNLEPPTLNPAEGGSEANIEP